MDARATHLADVLATIVKTTNLIQSTALKVVG